MISSSTHRIAVVVAALVALAAFTSIAQAGRPTGMTKAEFRALMLRSQGLNKLYGVGQGSGPIVSEKTAGLTQQPEPVQTIVASDDGFDWSDAGIGAAGAFGLVLLAGGLVAGSRHTRQSARVRTS